MPSSSLTRWFFCAALGLTLCPLSLPGATSITLPNGFVVYNSGTSVSGGVDQFYSMTLNPFNGSANANPGEAGYLSNNAPDSFWLSPAGVNQNTPESIYRIGISIDLTGIDLSEFTLNGYWLSDNQGLDVLVNGNSTGQGNSGSHLNPVESNPLNAFTLSSNLVSGMNLIEFEWGNGPAGNAGSQNPNPTHVLVEFEDYAFVPEPNTGLFLALASLTLWFRRARQ